MTGSLCPRSLRGHPGTAPFPLKHGTGRCHSPRPRNIPRSDSGQGPTQTTAGPTFTLTCILIATGAEATVDSSGTRTPPGLGRPGLTRAPATRTPSLVSARPRPSTGRVPTPGGKAAGPALREGPRGCQNFSYDNHLRVETRGLESQHFANPTYSRSLLDTCAPGSTHSHLGPRP